MGLFGDVFGGGGGLDAGRVHATLGYTHDQRGLKEWSRSVEKVRAQSRKEIQQRIGLDSREIDRKLVGIKAELAEIQAMRADPDADLDTASFDRRAKILRAEVARLDALKAAIDIDSSDADLARQRIDKLIPSIGRSTVMLGLFGGAALAGAKGVSALVGGTVSLTSALTPMTGAAVAVPGVLGAIGQAAGVLAVAQLPDLSEALRGNEEALKRLTPEAQQFVAELKEMEPRYRRLQSTAQEPLFAGLDDGLDRAMDNFPVLNSILGDTADELGGFARQFGTFLGREGFGDDLLEIGEQSNRTLDQLGNSTLHWADTIRQLLVAGGPFIDWMGRNVEQFSALVEEETKAGRETGRLAAFFDESRQALHRFWEIGEATVGTLFNLGEASKPFGEEMLVDIRDGAEALERLTGSVEGQNELREYFKDSSETLHELSNAIADILDEGSISESVARAITLAVPIVAENAGELGLAVIKGLVEGFVESDSLLARLFTVAAFIRLVGGPGALRKIGVGIAGYIAAPIAGTIAAGAAGGLGGAGAAGVMGGGLKAGALAAVKRAGLLGVGVMAGDALITGVQDGIDRKSDDILTALENQNDYMGGAFGDVGGFLDPFNTVFKEGSDESKELEKSLRQISELGFDITAEREAELQAMANTLDLTDAQRESMESIIDLGRRRAEQEERLAKIGVSVEIDTPQDGIDQFLGGIAKLRSGVYTSFEDIQRVSKRNSALISQTLGRDTEEGREAAAKNMRATANAIESQMRRSGDVTEEGMDRVKRLIRRADLTEGIRRQHFAKSFARQLAEGEEVTDKGLDKIVAQFKRMPDEARQETYSMMMEQVRELRRGGDLSRREADKIRSRILSEFTDLKRGGVRSSFDLLSGFARNFGDLGDVVGEGVTAVKDAMNAGLTKLGANPVEFAIKAAGNLLSGKGQRFERGGFLPGTGRRDTVPVLAAPDEAFLTGHQQGPVEVGLAASKAMGIQPYGSLDELFRRDTRSHTTAAPRRRERGGIAMPGTGTQRSYRGLSGDLDFIPALGRALSAMSQSTGTPIYVQSGFRTFAEQAALQGGPNPAAPPGSSNHERGFAGDITPGFERFGSVAKKFGLTFPLLGIGEPWHVELSDPGSSGFADIKVPRFKIKGGGVLGRYGNAALQKFQGAVADRLREAQQAAMAPSGIAQGGGAPPFSGGGTFSATSYGPPWGGINGTGVTATGVDLTSAPAKHLIAVDPSVIPLGSKVRVWPNPFGYTGTFGAEDTGGAILGKRIDIYDWRGRDEQLAWGQRDVKVKAAAKGGFAKLLKEVRKLGRRVGAADERIAINEDLFSDWRSEGKEELGEGERATLIDQNVGLLGLLKSRRNTIIEAISVGTKQQGRYEDKAEIDRDKLRKLQEQLKSAKGERRRSQIQAEIDKLREKSAAKRDKFQQRADATAGEIAELRGWLEEIQGQTGKGGRIFETRRRLAELRFPVPEEGTAAEDNTPEILRLLQEIRSGQRTAESVSLQQSGIFAAFERGGRAMAAQLPPFAGTFHRGGVIPGPVGAERTAIVQAGEGISAVGATPKVEIVFADGMGWLADFVDVRAEGVMVRRTRSAAASRGFPSSTGRVA